jgi:hypothetical protein
MSKNAWRAFVRWLDDASVDELGIKLVQSMSLLNQLTEADLKASLKQMIRLIQEEQVIRLGIQTRLKKRRN